MNNKLLILIVAAVVLSACGGVGSSEKKEKSEGKGVKEMSYKYASMKDGVLHLDLSEIC